MQFRCCQQFISCSVQQNIFILVAAYFVSESYTALLITYSPSFIYTSIRCGSTSTSRWQPPLSSGVSDMRCAPFEGRIYGRAVSYDAVSFPGDDKSADICCLAVFEVKRSHIPVV